MINNYYLLPEFTPARLQDLVLWFEPASFRGNTWYNLAPNYSDRNHGTAHGGVGLSTWHPQFPPALEFHAGDDYIELPLDIVFDDEMTIEILFELYNRSGYGRVLGGSNNKSHDIRTYVNDTKQFYFFTQNPSGSYNVYFYLDDWYIKTHGLWTWKYDSSADQTTLKAYKDGEFKQTTTFSGKVQLPNIYLRLGHWKTAGMKGKIYLVRFYHKVLSDAEIMHNYTHHPLYFLQRGIDSYDFIKRKKFYFL